MSATRKEKFATENNGCLLFCEDCALEIEGDMIMYSEAKIKNLEELEFAIFCIENIAARLGVKAGRVYNALTQKSNILSGYIVPEYEILHTQSKDYIVDDIIELLKERNVEV